MAGWLQWQGAAQMLSSELQSNPQTSQVNADILPQVALQFPLSCCTRGRIPGSSGLGPGPRVPALLWWGLHPLHTSVTE